MQLQLAALIANILIEDQDGVAFAALIAAPALAGLLLVFLVFVALRLMDRERDGLDGQEIAAYRDWARLAAIGILFSLSATVASFGYLINWWGVLEVTATLFIASVVSVAVLTVSVLRRTGVI